MAVNLSPLGGVAAQFFNNDGVPLSGGLIYTYTAGTNTPANTYTTGAGTIPHSNPIVLDSAGRVPTGEIWLTDGVAYKFVIKDAQNNLIGTYDNIVGINSNFVNYTASQEIQTATAGQTVFTLTTMAYQPGTNSLSVFVDGVNQYGPGAQYAFTETSSTSVTFASGLHVGASVKFTTAVINNIGGVDASQVTYTPPFTGGETTNVEAKLAQTISADDFGADPTGVVDSTSALQDALNAAAGGVLTLSPHGTYKCSAQLEIKGTIQGNGATLMFYGTVISALVYQNTEGSIYGLTIDGTNVSSCERGLLVNTDFDQKNTCYYRLKIQNISNSDNTQPAEGANFYRASTAARLTGSFDISIDVENITATPNGTVGDNGGAAMGIGVGQNGTGMNMTYYVHDCYVKNITPSEDAIAFYAYTGDHTIATAKGTFVWERCRAYESAKYSFKIQAPNATIRDCYAENLTTAGAEQFTAYGYNVTYDRCVGRVVAGGYVFVTRARRTTFLNCKAFSSVRNPMYGIYSTAETCTLESCYAESNSTTLLNDDPIIRYEGAFATVINNFVAYKTTTTNLGTVVEVTGTGVDLNINGMYASGFYRGFYPAYSGGVIRLRNSVIKIGTGQGIYGLGTTGQTLDVSDTYFSGANGILMDAAASFDIVVDNCTFNVSSLGVGGTAGKTRVTNCVFTSATTASGAAIVCTDVVARNNRVNKFQYGIDYAYSTTAEVADNVCVDTATPFVTTGYTPFATYNNYSR